MVLVAVRPVREVASRAILAMEHPVPRHAPFAKEVAFAPGAGELASDNTIRRGSPASRKLTGEPFAFLGVLSCASLFFV